MSRLRIAFARIAQETNALSPVPTTLADFKRTHFLEGDALLRACGRFGTEAPGFARNAELSGFVRAARQAGEVAPVPLFSAWAIPGGPLDRPTFETLRDRLVRELEAAGPLDGLFLSLHGAMGAEGTFDPDGDFLAAARLVMGDRPIAATFDLHGQLTPRKVNNANILAAYRTNPHRDHARVGRRAGDLLVRTLRGQIQPVAAWRSLPMLLGGGSTVDFLAPMRGIFAEMRRMERDPRVLYASLFMCHLWNDDPELGWSAHVLTDGAPHLAEQLAERLADMAWAVKDRQPPTFLAPADAIAQAREARLARRTGVVCLSDTSDVVSAGAVGESTELLRALLENAADLRTYAAIRDAEVIEALWSRAIGDRVDVEVGGKLDPQRNQSLPITGLLERKDATEAFGRTAVVVIDRLRLVITEGAPLVMKPAFYTDRGLRIWDADLVVVKNFFPFLLYFAPYSRKNLFVRTRGITDFDAAHEIQFAGPMHPRDAVHDWRPADRRRRAAG
ncbi:MAG: M81 family metallopeptidase [Myxococcales bacterium]|nr:M81 family metallopeptidase [Myxococcales bacterium]